MTGTSIDQLTDWPPYPAHIPTRCPLIEPSTSIGIVPSPDNKTINKCFQLFWPVGPWKRGEVGGGCRVDDVRSVKNKRFTFQSEVVEGAPAPELNTLYESSTCLDRLCSLSEACRWSRRVNSRPTGRDDDLHDPPTRRSAARQEEPATGVPRAPHFSGTRYIRQLDEKRDNRLWIRVWMRLRSWCGSATSGFHPVSSF
ncbi:hypothetical protein J6590_029240 [Homalodisca vitripennis]|nr:hypothetical protein J6590_029240 [Homalodisca vitripennis]